MNEDNVNIEALFTNIPENWEKVKDHVENTILPTIKNGQAITTPMCDEFKDKFLDVARDCRKLAKLAKK